MHEPPRTQYLIWVTNIDTDQENSKEELEDQQ